MADNPDKVTEGTAGVPADHIERRAQPFPEQDADPKPGAEVDPEQTIEKLKVNGKWVEMTRAEMRARAQKAVAADEQFRDGKAMQKQMLEFRESLKDAVESADPERLAAHLQGLGINDQLVKRFFDQVVEERGAPPAPSPKSAKDGTGVLEERLAAIEKALNGTTNSPIDFGKLAPDLKRAFAQLENDRITKIRDHALDSDRIIGQYLGKAKAEQAETVRTLANELIAARLKSVGTFGDGTQILEYVVPQIRTVIQALGSSERATPPLGLGSAPAGSGDTTSTPEKPKRANVNDAGFVGSVRDLLAYHMKAPAATASD